MSKKEISRRDFIKGAAGAAGVAALGVLAGCAKTPEATPTPEQKPQGLYTPGEYKATAKGHHRCGAGCVRRDRELRSGRR